MAIPRTYLALDSGTTNTRIWLIHGGKVAGKAQVQAGVRDTARTGSTVFLKDAIRGGIGQVLEQTGQRAPEVAVAAGMIGSELGLLEVRSEERRVGKECRL